LVVLRCTQCSAREVIERQQLVKVEGDLGCAVGQRTVRADAAVESIPGYDLTLPLREAAR